MSRAAALLVGLILLSAGILLALYGLFAILYEGDSSGNRDTYVTFSDHKIDADLAGAIALLIALLLLLTAIPLLRRRRNFVKPS